LRQPLRRLNEISNQRNSLDMVGHRVRSSLFMPSAKTKAMFDRKTAFIWRAYVRLSDPYFFFSKRHSKDTVHPPLPEVTRTTKDLIMTCRERGQMTHWLAPIVQIASAHLRVQDGRRLVGAVSAPVAPLTSRAGSRSRLNVHGSRGLLGGLSGLHWG